MVNMASSSKNSVVKASHHRLSHSCQVTRFNGLVKAVNLSGHREDGSTNLRPVLEAFVKFKYSVIGLVAIRCVSPASAWAEKTEVGQLGQGRSTKQQPARDHQVLTLVLAPGMWEGTSGWDWRERGQRSQRRRRRHRRTDKKEEEKGDTEETEEEMGDTDETGGDGDMGGRRRQEMDDETTDVLLV